MVPNKNEVSDFPVTDKHRPTVYSCTASSPYNGNSHNHLRGHDTLRLHIIYHVTYSTSEQNTYSHNILVEWLNALHSLVFLNLTPPDGGASWLTIWACSGPVDLGGGPFFKNVFRR